MRNRLLTTNFPLIIAYFVCSDSKSILDFHVKLFDISNYSYTLGEKYSYAKLVNKVLGSLPKRFIPKVISIAELTDSLQTYKLTLKRWDKKNLGINPNLKHYSF